jgi:hypothetical protein
MFAAIRCASSLLATWLTLGKPLKRFAPLRCRFYSARVHVHKPLIAVGEGQNTEIVKWVKKSNRKWFRVEKHFPF